MTKYQQFVAMAEPVVLLQLEAYYRDVIPRGKLLRQVGSGIYVSENELWNAYRDSNEKATVQYVSFDPLVRVSDDQIDIASDEISDYYRDNLEEFSVPASATVISASFTKAPTPADTAAIEVDATELRQSILDGADFAETARAESTDEISAEEGGNLGVFAKGLMTPAFDSAVFAARLNQITDPVKTPFGLHLIEVTDRWGQDSAQARHILLPFERTDESEIDLLAMADSLDELGEAMALGEAAAILGLETDTLDLIETLAIIPGAGDAAEGGEWVFDPGTSPGDVSPVFENSAAFYAIELVTVDPARYLSRGGSGTRDPGQHRGPEEGGGGDGGGCRHGRRDTAWPLTLGGRAGDRAGGTGCRPLCPGSVRARSWPFQRRCRDSVRSRYRRGFGSRAGESKRLRDRADRVGSGGQPRLG